MIVGINLQLKIAILIFFFFWDQICPKRVFPVENGKSEHHHLILHIRNGQGTKFQLKLTILNFWIKFTQKGYSLSKTAKMNITAEFCSN